MNFRRLAESDGNFIFGSRTLPGLQGHSGLGRRLLQGVGRSPTTRKRLQGLAEYISTHTIVKGIILMNKQPEKVVQHTKNFRSRDLETVST